MLTNPVIATDPESYSQVKYLEPQESITFRELDPGGHGRELGFVYDSWTRAVARDSIWQPLVGKRGVARTPVPPSLSLYYHDITLKKLLPKCTLLGACDPDDLDVILGYVCYESARRKRDPYVLHFVYVKGGFRRLGIGSRLLREAGIDLSEDVVVSHRTEHLFKCWPEVKWLWNPYRSWV
jgi:ribosomal protein S18 acetylase RimI-like enzyme